MSCNNPIINESIGNGLFDVWNMTFLRQKLYVLNVSLPYVSVLIKARSSVIHISSSCHFALPAPFDPHLSLYPDGNIGVINIEMKRVLCYLAAVLLDNMVNNSQLWSHMPKVYGIIYIFISISIKWVNKCYSHRIAVGNNPDCADGKISAF